MQISARYFGLPPSCAAIWLTLFEFPRTLPFQTPPPFWQSLIMILITTPRPHPIKIHPVIKRLNNKQFAMQ